MITSSCNLTRYVPHGEYLVDKVEIVTDDKKIKSSELKTYTKQKTNHKTFGFIPMQLSLSS